MKKVLILADSPDWCFDRRAKAIQSYAPAGWDVRIDYHGQRGIAECVPESFDLVFVLDPHQAKSIRQYFTLAGLKIPLVGSHNSGTGRPGYSMDETLAAADWVIVNNHGAWASNLFGQREYRACNISNGVDTRTFFSEIPWAERPNRALWIGSVAKADDKDDVKGFQTVLRPLGAVLERRTGIIPDFRTATPGNALDAVEMRAWYNTGRYVVCTSKSEGTPNIILEGAACGCIPVSTAVGNVPELVVHGRNGRVVHRRDTLGFLDTFELTPAERWPEYAAGITESIKSWDWEFRAPYYYAVWGALIADRKMLKPFTYLNSKPEEIGV